MEIISDSTHLDLLRRFEDGLNAYDSKLVAEFMDSRPDCDLSLLIRNVVLDENSPLLDNSRKCVCESAFLGNLTRTASVCIQSSAVTESLLVYLQEAAERGYSEITRILLSEHERVNPADNQSYALVLAAEHSQSEVMKLLLLDGRSDPSIRDNIVLTRAIEHGMPDIVKLALLDERSDPNFGDGAFLRMACNYGETGIVQLLLEDGRADPSAAGSSSLFTAALYGYHEIVRLLLEDGRAAPMEDGRLSLLVACDQGHTQVVQLLLSDGRSDPALMDSMALQKAVYHNLDGVVRLLLADGRADPAVWDNHLLKTAYVEGYHGIVQMLLHDKPTLPPCLNQSQAMNNSTGLNIDDTLGEYSLFDEYGSLMYEELYNDDTFGGYSECDSDEILLPDPDLYLEDGFYFEVDVNPKHGLRSSYPLSQEN